MNLGHLVPSKKKKKKVEKLPTISQKAQRNKLKGTLNSQKWKNGNNKKE